MNFLQILSRFKESLGDEFFDNLEKIDEESLAPFAVFLGVDKKNLCALIKLVPKIVRGEITLKSLIPHILPVVISYFLLPKIEDDEQEKDESDKDGTSKSPASIYENVDEQKSSDRAQAFETPFFAQKNAAAEQVCSVADDDIFYSLNCYMQN